MSGIVVSMQLNCTGLACPMLIVKIKKAIDQLQAGQVIEGCTPATRV